MAQAQRVLSRPPVVEHKELTKELTAEEIAVPMADYLKRSLTGPYMHPDAWLSTDGVRHGPKSGPSGGWAIHHLRRIEAGFRGESLAAETEDELVEKFGEDAVKSAGYKLSKNVKSDGDDTRVDGVIEESTGKIEDEKARKKREKKERAQREKAEKAGKENQPSTKKRKRTDWDDSDASELPESKANTRANTPYADSMTAFSETWQTKESEWQDKDEYEQSQKELVGEIGNRDGAPVVKQDGEPPVVVEHDIEGNVKVPGKTKTAEEKAARKAAKKARRAEEKDAEKNEEPVVKEESETKKAKKARKAEKAAKAGAEG